MICRMILRLSGLGEMNGTAVLTPRRDLNEIRGRAWLKKKSVKRIHASVGRQDPAPGNIRTRVQRKGKHT